jgi:hypothetical protein
MGLLPLTKEVIQSSGTIIFFTTMYIPHSPNSLSSHTEDVVLGPAEREGSGGSSELEVVGAGGGARLGCRIRLGRSTGSGKRTRGNSASSISRLMIGDSGPHLLSDTPR